jgi:thioesterase domain-containing protein
MFGNVLNLRHMALPFAPERRVIGVQARGLIGETPPHNDITEAARDYLAEIRKLQPEGPYLLAGYSGGGVTAYEMAQQLQAAGQDVAVLAMLDTPLPVRPGLSRPDKALIKLAEIRSKGPGYLVEWARSRWAWERGKRRRDDQATDPATGVEFNDLKVQRGFLEGVGKYRTPRWDGPLTLFRPPLDLHWKVTGDRWVSSEREYVFEDNDWRQFAPNLEVIEVPGDHVSMVLAPNVTTLSQELREVIARALETRAEAWQQATAAE